MIAKEDCAQAPDCGMQVLDCLRVKFVLLMYEFSFHRWLGFASVVAELMKVTADGTLRGLMGALFRSCNTSWCCQR